MQTNANSKIKVLGISPVSTSRWYHDPGDRADANMHRYPHYYYLRGNIQDCLGRNKVVGVPVEFERCMADMSLSTILQYRP
jgi:hypothetical protein